MNVLFKERDLLPFSINPLCNKPSASNQWFVREGNRRNAVCQANSRQAKKNKAVMYEGMKGWYCVVVRCESMTQACLPSVSQQPNLIPASCIPSSRLYLHVQTS